MSDYEYFSSPIHDTWSSRSFFTTWDSTSIPQSTESSYVPNPERQALWDSLSVREKITGTLLSLLVGGGAPFLIGYIMT